MDSYPHILSIIEEYLGHKTYGHLMRDYFSQAMSCKVDFYWYNDERELRTRILNKLLSYYPANRWMQDQNLTLHLFRFQLGFGYMARRLALRKLQQADYSLLHVHTQPLAYLSLDLMDQVPTVVSLDRTIAQASRETTAPQFRWTYAPNNFLEQRVFQKAARVVAFSEIARRSVIEDYEIDPGKVNVVYPGVDFSQLPLPVPSTHSAVKPYTILFIGGDFDRKGGRDLLAVFLAAFADQAELHLVTRSAIHCDHPNVHIHRTIEAYTPAWLALYHQADVFVMPTYSEPFGWVFIEAMAAGLPIVATQLSAVPEMVTHGKTGFLIQPGDRAALADSLRTLITNPALGRELGRNGRKIAESKFDADKNFQMLESLFQEVAIANRQVQFDLIPNNVECG
ncbi:MAG: glycosyltransferase family 4 protein [Leptolyngbyaceae cyanobacterium RU_5_1]|nr:glycosyltransferase family 4 protein [Leptolyngbyaceae cyanobacterium RU_5_1]